MRADEEAAFAIVATAALELVGSDDEDAEGLVRLATDLVATERRGGALNLNRGRQMLSCLLRWHLES